MNGWLLFGAGLLGLPGLVLAGMTGWVAWRERRRTPPGSGAARRAGCICPRIRNWFGAREALLGTSRLCPACPVVEHRPPVRRLMYKDGN